MPNINVLSGLSGQCFDTSVNWATINPVVPVGVLCIEDLGTGEYKLKIGNGVNNWDDLDYFPSATASIPLATESEFGIAKRATLLEVLNGLEQTKFVTPYTQHNYHTQDGHKTVPATGTTSGGKVLGAGSTEGDIFWTEITLNSLGAAAVDHLHALVTGSADGFMSKEDKTKLDGIEENANYYAHPSSHPATMIDEDAAHRFVTDPEKLSWNGKQDPATTLAGYGITDATPSSHIGSGGSAHSAASTTVNGFMSSTDKSKLDSIAENANNYIHPASHPATMITEDTSHRFVTDLEKTEWNGKQDPETTLAGYGITDATPLSHVGSTGTSHGVATSDVNGFMSSTDKSKLDGVEAGANNYIHPTTHAASIITEDADHRFVTDLEKSTWNGKQNALGFTPENASNKNQANGYAGLDSEGKILSNLIPSIALMDVFEAETELAMLSLSSANRGDICIRSDLSKTYILTGDDYSELVDWKELKTPTDAVISVAGKTGAVTLSKNDVGLGNVDNTEDAVKSVASAAKLTTGRTITLSGDISGSNAVAFDGSSDIQIDVTIADDSHNHIISNVDGLQDALDAKAPSSHIGSGGSAHALVSGTIAGFMSGADKTKLDGIAEGANNYSHPASHPASMITQDASNRFVSDLEKQEWNSKQDPATTLAGYGITDAAPLSHVGSTGSAHGPATVLVDGFMTSEDKVKLDGVAVNANNYSHPNHTGDVTSLGDGSTVISNAAVTNLKMANMASGSIKGRVSAGPGAPEDLSDVQVRAFLNVEDGANAYVHPASHPATMIVQDSSNRFVSDTEKSTWNSKPDLGETSATAYRGDRGKIAYDHSQSAHAPVNAQKNSDITQAEIEAKLVGVITSHDHSSISGNAGSATKLTTARTINGVLFDGTENITVADATKQPLSAELTAIAALPDSVGIIKKTGADTYILDTTDYSVNGHDHVPGDITQDASNRFVTDVQIAAWDAKQSALGFTPENSANKNVANGYAGLDASGKILESALPALAITDVFESSSEAGMLALSTAETGDICIRSDLNKSFVLAADDPSVLTNWKELRTPTDSVLSVAGKTGVVTLVKADVGLNNVNNTADLNKPISYSTQSALDLKVDTSRTINTKPLSADVVLTTADIADSTDKRYVTDAQLNVLENTSGTNTGNETAASIGTILNGATAKTTPVDADTIPLSDSAASGALKKLTWGNLLATAKTYFDTLYNKYVHPNHSGDVTSVADGATTIAANVVSNSKLSTVNTATIKGRATAGTGNVEDLTATQVRTILNVADGANNYTHPATHPPSIIVQDSTNRFVTDAEKTAWNAKSDLALGESSTTAYRGDRGKIAYDHSQSAHAPSTAQKNSDILKSEIEAVFTGTITSHAHNLNDLTEKNFASLANKPTTLSGYGITDAAPSSHIGATGTAHGAATTLVNGFMSSTDKSKLDGISAGANAYVHPNHTGDVTSVADGATTIAANAVSNTKLADMAASTIKGRISTSGDPQDLTVAQVLTLLNVEAGANNYVHPATHAPSIIVQDANNRFVTDTEKSTWNGKQNALGFTPENTANKNTANGYAGLDANGKILESVIPSIALMDVYEAATEAAMLALSNARVGDICIRSDVNKTFILATDGYSTLANWKELRTPTDSVQSVAGKTGVVTLTKSDVGLANVDNTSDANKPISTATQTALNAKVSTSTTVNGQSLSANVTLTTANIADSTDKRYVTDAKLAVLNNTSGTNSGDETATTLGTKINGATEKTTPVDADLIPIADSAASFILKKLTWANLKATLKTYFDTLYNNYTHPTSGVTAGTYKSVTVDVNGHVSAGTNPTTLAGYGITDAAPSSHVGATGAAHGIVTTSVNGFMSAADKTKLDGIATGANNYTHPANHPASIITQDSSNRFVTDAQITNWDTAYTHSQSAHAPSNAQANADITKAEIEAKLTGTITSHSHSTFSGDLENYNDKLQALGSVSGSVAINMANGNVISMTIAGATTLSFTGLTSGKSRTFMLKITNGGAFTLTFPGTVVWAAGSAPVLKTSGLDVLVCNTVDGGTTTHVAVW